MERPAGARRRARRRDRTALEYEAVTFGGFSLEDHWNQGDARAAIATGRWNVVIMQQGPSALPESQVDLRLWAGRFADEARAVGTRPALLTVWPESYRRPALSDVIVSYRNAAEAAGAQLFPAGEAWHAAWDCNARLPLYGPDGFHPSPLGTYAAALVVYGRLFKAPLLAASLQDVRHGSSASAPQVDRRPPGQSEDKRPHGRPPGVVAVRRAPQPNEVSCTRSSAWPASRRRSMPSP